MTALRNRPAILAFLVGLGLLAAGPASANTGGFGYDQAPAFLSAPGQILGKPVEFSGRIEGADAGETIEIQRMNAQSNWVTITTATAGENGKFTAKWLPTRSGKLLVRAVLSSATTPPTGVTVRAANPIPASSISVYRPFRATWFGPGFYGNRTSCGQLMTTKLQGVAHKRLPCGTRIEIMYRGRTVTVPVIDRGPFRHNTEFDLTYATAKRLKFKHVARLGALTLRD